MSRRVFHECDRCERSVEGENIPSYWVSIEATPEPYRSEQWTASVALKTQKKLWCDSCWKSVSVKLPRATTEAA